MSSIIVIPTLDPNNKLINLINDLRKQKLDNILIIDDGSIKGEEFFEKIEELNVPIIHHDKNYGKGYAIKTGFKNAKKYYPDVTAIITVDGDYQHHPIDIKKIDELLTKKNCLILGVRDFTKKDVPLRSKFGNKMSSIFFKLKTGYTLNDTQTGLRGIPYKYYDLVLSIPGDRFDYEMNFLFEFINKKIEIVKTPIRTIYEDKNHESHFKTFSDSYIIYRKEFNMLIAAIISLMLFVITINISKNLIYIFLIAGLSKMIFNIITYLLNNDKLSKKNILFKIFNVLVNALLITVLSLFNINIILIKIFVDIILFIINIALKRSLIK